MSYRKKLIEVALPLEAINEASAREKSIRHGHPSTLHLWWARRPLAAARAVIFASLVDDPDSPDALPAFVEACKQLPIGANVKANGDTPRMRLFDFIERLVTWEATTDEAILNTARELIQIATEGNPPPLLDPFAGGGSIPLEAQRLGLEAHASDLNPVAVMINKAQIEIPPRFANMPPVNPRDREQIGKETWRGAAGLAADVRYYGEWMREKAWERIGHLYPMHNGETVIAWLWARTVKSPNPAFKDVDVPLVRSFELSNKSGAEAWIEPIVSPDRKHVSFKVHNSKGKIPSGTVGKAVGGGRCLVSDTPITWSYLKTEGNRGQIGTQLMAVVTEGNRRRNFYSPDNVPQLDIPKSDFLDDIAATEISGYFNPPLYGYRTIGSMFTQRQKICVETFADLVGKAKTKCIEDGGSEEYARALAVYLTLAVGRLANRLSSFTIWNITGLKIEQTFSEQGVGMAWDFAEANPFSDSTGSWSGSLEWIPKCLETTPTLMLGKAYQRDAALKYESDSVELVSTDPPYYASITYADFSDFFYGIFRYALRRDFPDLFSTIATPKIEEAVAAWHRFDGDRAAASRHFTDKLKSSVESIVHRSLFEYPVTIYYAFKESELNKESEGFFTAWESILSVIIEGGLQIIRTWPIRTERTTGRKERKNVLASSIVIVCRQLSLDAPTISRRQFVDALRRELPAALKEMQSGNIAPVDLAQASIGPGMAIYSRYSKVLEADGSAMSVRAALGLINQELDAYLAEQDGDIDADTRFAVSWFEQFGFNEGEFGQADVLARAKNTSVAGVEAANIVVAGRGKVRLLHWKEYDPGTWDPQQDKRPTVWEATHHLIERLNNHGETGSAMLMTKMPHDMAAEARNLAYRLYSICERKGWADHARDYNALVISWAGIGEETARLREAAESGQATQQMGLFGEE